MSPPPNIDARPGAVFVARMFIIIGGDGKEYGPVTTDQIRAWITAGRANLETQAKLEGSAEWQRLGDFAEFSGAPVPPLVESESRDVVRRDATETAGRGARIGAALVNAMIYLLSTIPGSLLISRKLLEQNPELAQGGLPKMDELDLAPLMGGVMWVWIGILGAVVFQAILLGLRGQNLGKMLVGIRVVRVDNGESAGFVRGALLRFLVPFAIMVVLNALTAVLGFFFLLVDFCFIFREDGRCLHDLMAGTKVVKA